MRKAWHFRPSRGLPEDQHLFYKESWQCPMTSLLQLTSLSFSLLPGNCLRSGAFRSPENWQCLMMSLSQLKTLAFSLSWGLLEERRRPFTEDWQSPMTSLSQSVNLHNTMTPYFHEKLATPNEIIVAVEKLSYSLLQRTL